MNGKKYAILSKATIEELEEEVNSYISLGRDVQGGMSVVQYLHNSQDGFNRQSASNWFNQTMMLTYQLDLFPMTYAQQRVYNCFCENLGITYEDASDVLNVTPSAIHKHIVNLEKKGYVERDSGGKVRIVVNKPTDHTS